MENGPRVELVHLHRDGLSPSDYFIACRNVCAMAWVNICQWPPDSIFDYPASASLTVYRLCAAASKALKEVPGLGGPSADWGEVTLEDLKRLSVTAKHMESALDLIPPAGVVLREDELALRKAAFNAAHRLFGFGCSDFLKKCPGALPGDSPPD